MDTNTTPPNTNPELRSHTRLKILVSSLALLVIVGIVGVWVWVVKQPSGYKQSGPNPSNSEISTSVDSSNDQTETTTPTEPTTWNPYDPACKFRLDTPNSKTGLALWTTPKALGEQKIFYPNSSEVPEGREEHGYQVGKMLSGRYQDANILLFMIIPDGPGPLDVIRVLEKNGTYTLLTKYSTTSLTDEYDIKALKVKLQKDNSAVLPDLELPEALTLKSPDLNLTYAKPEGFFSNGIDFFCADDLTPIHTDQEVGAIYIDKLDGEGKFSRNLGAFYVKAPDSTLRVYRLDPPFIGQDRIPLVTWQNNTVNKDEYSHRAVSGCGVTRYLDIDPEVSVKDLKIAGATVNGDKIYEFADPNNQYLKSFYETRATQNPNSPQTGFQEFLNAHPIFFWQDPLGRFVRFENAKFLPLAECAKPVIYLYPTKTQRVNVRVEPQGGLLFAEPSYPLNGWTVNATPNGKITNLADGKVYPYLFWEGRGGMYATPGKGFVARQEDLSADLTEKLGQFGFNETEIKDFLEYWIPEMQAAPYYFYTFLDTDMVDKLAPLTITPKPDTVIRVVMDFRPLKSPITVTGYDIKKTERHGFTVVEWGGVKR